MTVDYRIEPLERLRHRLTAWYVATLGGTLLLLGAGLFWAVSRAIAAKLDDSLDHAAEVMTSALRATPRGTDPLAELREIQIPDRSLYLFVVPDGAAARGARGAPFTPLVPDTASRWVVATAARAARDGAASLHADIGDEHMLQVRAVRVLARDRRYVVAAAADTEEVEDEYALVIAAFAGTALVALLLVAVAGYGLARKSTAPVAASLLHQRRFMADAAHELRTPVAVLRARADVTLAQARDASAYAAAVREMRGEAERLGRILDDLFALARADAGERPVERSRVFLDDVVLDAAGAARAVGAQKGVTVDVAEFGEAQVVGDSTLLRQLLMAVLDNAVKYTPAGGRVTVGVSVVGEHPTVSVEDTGIGIPPEALPHVFERFYRADRARGRSGGDDPGGAGLGLAIARWIADQHGADVEVAAPANGGTRVEIRFPRLAEA